MNNVYPIKKQMPRKKAEPKIEQGQGRGNKKHMVVHVNGYVAAKEMSLRDARLFQWAIKNRHLMEEL